MRQIMEVREMLRDAFAKRMQEQAGVITAGRAADYAEYKKLVGRLQGHDDGLRIVDEVFKRLTDEGEDN